MGLGNANHRFSLVLMVSQFINNSTLRTRLLGLLIVGLWSAAPISAGDWHSAYESLAEAPTEVSPLASDDFILEESDVVIPVAPEREFHDFLNTAPKPKTPKPAKKTKIEYKVDREKIYWGQPESFKYPAVIEAEEVYKQIPAYKKIREEKLEKDDPEYWPLMRKAARSFVSALKKACKSTSHDLVGEIGSIKATGTTIPDITKKVISFLSVKPKKKRGPNPTRVE